jgi:hypothetical protein
MNSSGSYRYKRSHTKTLKYEESTSLLKPTVTNNQALINK